MGYPHELRCRPLPSAPCCPPRVSRVHWRHWSSARIPSPAPVPAAHRQHRPELHRHRLRCLVWSGTPCVCEQYDQPIPRLGYWSAWKSNLREQSNALSSAAHCPSKQSTGPKWSLPMPRTRQLVFLARAAGVLLPTALVWMLAPAKATAQTEDVIWRAAVGVTVSGNDLTKTAAAGWGNAGAVSVQTIESNGFVEFSGNGTVMAGLSKGDTDQTYQDIDFAIYLAGSAVSGLRVRRAKGLLGSYVSVGQVPRGGGRQRRPLQEERRGLLHEPGARGTFRCSSTARSTRPGSTSSTRASARRASARKRASRSRRASSPRRLRWVGMRAPSPSRTDPLRRRLGRVHGDRDEQEARRWAVERRHRQDRGGHRLRDRLERERDGRGAGRRRLPRCRRLVRLRRPLSSRAPGGSRELPAERAAEATRAPWRRAIRSGRTRRSTT